LEQLLAVLRAKGYRIVGPTLSEGAIVYDEVERLSDLPANWTDEQEAGSYRLKRRSDGALFGYNVGPHSWKKFLHPPVLRLWRINRGNKGFDIESTPEPPPRLAFLGVRACDLIAIAVEDKVLAQGKYVDSDYVARRDNVFVIALNCGQAGGTCFCVSMNTGPKATTGFDLALTEVISDGRHQFVVEVGSEPGEEVFGEIAHREANDDEITAAERTVAAAASQMGRSMDTLGIKNLLYRNYENPRWDDVARRCLTCANCTMVCPTCFCNTVEDTTDLSGEHAERWRRWDSCFTMDFSYIHGGSVRSSVKSRYRQWMTHKLATWFDQFGSSGCVGCGRCITWCPVGIDITEEVRAIRESEQS
jgi:ferredoxin